MGDYNKVVLMGRLAADPKELNTGKNAEPVCSFSLAYNHRFKAGNDSKEEVHFFDVVCFAGTARACIQHLKKGNTVLVDGRLQHRRWTTPEGEKRSKVDVVANAVKFYGNGSHGDE